MFHENQEICFPGSTQTGKGHKKPYTKNSIERIFENAFIINRLSVRFKRWATRLLKGLTAANCLILRNETEMYRETPQCLARLSFKFPRRVTVYGGNML